MDTGKKYAMHVNPNINDAWKKNLVKNLKTEKFSNFNRSSIDQISIKAAWEQTLKTWKISIDRKTHSIDQDFEK